MRIEIKIKVINNGDINNCCDMCSFVKLFSANTAIQTKRVDDLSFESLIIGLISTLMWFLHGYFINDISIIASCVFSLGVSIPLLYLYIKYKKEKNEHIKASSFFSHS